MAESSLPFGRFHRGNGSHLTGFNATLLAQSITKTMTVVMSLARKSV